MMFDRKTPLSKNGKKYIQAHAKHHPVSTHCQRDASLKRFHCWCELENLKLSELSEDRMLEFDKWLEKDGLKTSTRTGIRRRLQTYFVWLYKKEILNVDPKTIFPRMEIGKKRSKITLPKRANDFLLLIGTQSRPSTVKNYKGALGNFYGYLNRNNLTVQRLGRSHLEKYMIELKNAGLSESTRSSRLINIRMYFRWLNENGFLKFNADRLIRNRDLPGLPGRLPRYLPHDIDQKLQAKFLESQNIFHLGFYLMRRTGIRIGELRCLQFDCIRQHTASQSFLKVELGKLNTERLVPIDAEIVEFIHKIQKKTRRYTKDPVRLIHRPNGKVPNQNDFFEAFREVTDKLKFKTPVVPHQMRHTYATELLNAGMNLSVIKELLGHKSLKMTALYAKVTLQTVVEEYTKASANYQSKFVIQKLEPPPDSGSDNPREILSDLILTLKKSKGTKTRPEIQLILRRLSRIEKDLRKLLVK